MAPPLVLGDGTVVSDVACPALPDAELSDLDSANGMSPDQSTEREIPAVIAATADVLDEFLKRATTLLGSSSKGASNALFLQLIMDLTDIVPLLHAPSDLMDLCERLLSLPFFESEDTTDDFILFIFECHGVTVRFVLSVNVDFKRHSHMREQNADTLALIFNLFNLIGHIHPNLCRRLGDSEEWMEKLHSSFLDDVQSGSVKSHPAIAFVLNEILSAQELSMDDLARCFGEDVVSCVLGRIEKERENEVYCYSLIRLLLLIDAQYQTKCRSNPSLVNVTLHLLSSKRSDSKTLSENLIFILNRSEDMAFQHTLILFIRRILEYSDQSLASQFFYTNDVLVMIDIAVREIRNLGPDQESLQQAYLSLLPGLAKVSAHVSSPNSMHKRSDMVKLLMELQGSRFSTDQVRRLATRIMENNEALSP